MTQSLKYYFVRMLPVVWGYLPSSIAFGLMWYEAHLSLGTALVMSLLVFAGSAQYIAVGLVAGGQTLFVIALTTFIVNLRHLLFASSLAPKLSKWKVWQQILFGLELTDETFAVNHSLSLKQDLLAKYAVPSNIMAHSTWIAGTALGYLIGSWIPDLKVFGFDYALPAMFIALICILMQESFTILLGLLSGALALVLIVYNFDSWSIILATLITSTLGLFFEKWLKKQSTSQSA